MIVSIKQQKIHIKLIFCQKSSVSQKIILNLMIAENLQSHFN